MKKLVLPSFLAAICLFSITACEHASDSNSSASSTERDSQNIVKITPDKFQPAFSKETVIKLNSIVSRQLTVIDEYDAVMNKARKAMKNSTHNQQAQLSQHSDIIDALSKRAKINLKDMTAAKKELIASEEKYNEATLAGMMTFVTNVDKEISAQSDLLHNSTKNIANM